MASRLLILSAVSATIGIASCKMCRPKLVAGDIEGAALTATIIHFRRLIQDSLLLRDNIDAALACISQPGRWALAMPPCCRCQLCKRHRLYCWLGITVQAPVND